MQQETSKSGSDMVVESFLELLFPDFSQLLRLGSLDCSLVSGALVTVQSTTWSSKWSTGAHATAPQAGVS